MVNVDELNKSIDDFGQVVEKVNNLPDIYQEIQEQQKLEKVNLETMNEIQEKQEKHMLITSEKLDLIERRMIDTLKDNHKELEIKMDKSELNLRDRIALLESNNALVISELKKDIDSKFSNLSDVIYEANIKSRKRFISTLCGIIMIIILHIIQFVI